MLLGWGSSSSAAFQDSKNCLALSGPARASPHSLLQNLPFPGMEEKVRFLSPLSTNKQRTF